VIAGRQTVKISDVMDRQPVCIKKGATFASAAELVSLKHVSELMVVDDDDRFVGVLSVGDLIRNTLPGYDELCRDGALLSAAWKVFLEKGEELSTAPIGPIMISRPVTFKSTDELIKAASTMICKQIHMLPVVDDGKLVGTISRGNLCHAVLANH
jgi:CBS domain-containing protein